MSGSDIRVPSSNAAAVLEKDGSLDASDGQDPMQQALQAIVEGTATATGTEFFYALVRELALALKVRYAFVCELLPCGQRVRTLAYWYNGRFKDNIEFELEGSPCEVVIQGETVYYTSGMSGLFPRDPSLVEMGIESYFGVPLASESGSVMMGHLALFHDQPLVKEFRGMALLRIFAARARAELERKRAEQALRQSQERLASVMASAMDAIVTLDAEQRVTLFNPAAEKIFRRSTDDMLGRPFEPFLSKRFANLLKGYCQAVQPATVNSQQLWAPEGLMARRGDGEEFLVEATLSPLELGGQHFYTLILRDVSERWQSAATLKQLQLENLYLQEEIKTRQLPGHLVGDSPAMRAVFAHAEPVAATDSTVLLTGETGTGKSVVARMIHDLSPRHGKLFVNVNCAALPGELVESELFGHEKGAFTGATAQRKGRFELADGGTLFLDEVGELSAGAQAKLLRVLQDQEFERVGGTQTLKVDVRLVAATNRDLAQMVQEGRFRADLYYRLNVFPIRLPSLSERPTDIPLLARHFLERFAKKMGKSVHDLSPQAREQLLAYAWPGNIRELQNVIERATILAQGPLLELGPTLDGHQKATGAVETATSIGSETMDSLETTERAHILRVLERTSWVIEGEQGAAVILALKPSTLRSRMRKLQIHKPR